jgi:hypothetical protein
MVQVVVCKLEGRDLTMFLDGKCLRFQTGEILSSRAEHQNYGELLLIFNDG